MITFLEVFCLFLTMGLPIVGIWLKQVDVRNIIILSITGCAVFFIIQLYSISTLITLGSWSSLEDTNPELYTIPALLLVFCLALNVLFVIIRRTSRSRKL